MDRSAQCRSSTTTAIGRAIPRELDEDGAERLEHAELSGPVRIEVGVVAPGEEPRELGTDQLLRPLLAADDNQAALAPPGGLEGRGQGA